MEQHPFLKKGGNERRRLETPVPEAEDDFFDNERHLVGVFDFDYDEIEDFETKVAWVSFGVSSQSHTGQDCEDGDSTGDSSSRARRGTCDHMASPAPSIRYSDVARYVGLSLMKESAQRPKSQVTMGSLWT
eukprot:g9168.t1